MTKETVPNDQLTQLTQQTFRNLRIKKRLTDTEFAVVFEKMVLDKYGTWTGAAQRWKCTTKFLGQIKAGTRPAPPNICDDLGYTKAKETFYYKN